MNNNLYDFQNTDTKNKFGNLGICITELMQNPNLIKPNIEKIKEKPEIVFPINFLPNWIQKMVSEHSESYGTPAELWAVAFLSGIASAAGKHICLVNGNYRNFPQLWIIVIGSSGTGKSDAGRTAYNRLLEIDKERYTEYQSNYQKWERNDKQGHPPHWNQTIIGDTTPEALFSVMAHNPNGLTLYRDELSGWFQDFGRYNKSGEIGHYLSIFDNQTFSINRKNEQPQLITDPFLNIYGTIQPTILAELFSKNDFEQSGLAQRFMFIYPEFPIRKYKRNEQKPSTELYEKIIDKIVGLSGYYEVFLSNESENVYEKFFNEMEEEKTKSNDFWKGVYSKAQIQALRLALTVKIARYVDEQPYQISNKISEIDMYAGIGMIKYFIRSLQKFKTEQKKPLNKKDIILEIFKNNPEANQHEIARILGISQQYISKVLKYS